MMEEVGVSEKYLFKEGLKITITKRERTLRQGTTQYPLYQRNRERERESGAFLRVERKKKPSK